MNRVDPSGLGWVKWLQHQTCVWWYWWWGRHCAYWVTLTYGVEVWWERNELKVLCELWSEGKDWVSEIVKLLYEIGVGVAFLVSMIGALEVAAMCTYYYWGCRWIYLKYVFGALMPIPLAKW